MKKWKLRMRTGGSAGSGSPPPSKNRSWFHPIYIPLFVVLTLVTHSILALEFPAPVPEMVTIDAALTSIENGQAQAVFMQTPAHGLPVTNVLIQTHAPDPHLNGEVLWSKGLVLRAVLPFGGKAFDRWNNMLATHPIPVQSGDDFPAPYTQGSPFLDALLSLFQSLLPLLLIYAFISMGMKRMASGLGQQSNKVSQFMESTVRFDDIAGCEEAKTELQEVLSFLKDPEPFRQLHAKIPRGVLLIGPPGNGKTMLAKAIANEAGCKLLYIQGSSLENMFVGSGSNGLRKACEVARKHAPAIVFIDEIDSIGRKRRGEDAQWASQTLNQLLQEMDGVGGQEDNVVFMGATNLAQSLDPALLRTGRFSRQITVSNPPYDARMALLTRALGQTPLAKDVVLDQWGRSLAARSGSDVANFVNEARLLAARRKSPVLRQIDFQQAFDRILMGNEQGYRLTADERRLVAVHEAGHALINVLSPQVGTVRKATILPRGQSLGSVIRTPNDEQILMRRSRLLEELRMIMGGRAAEEIVFGLDDVSTGVAGDRQAAESLARQMVEHWEMRPAPIHGVQRFGYKDQIEADIQTLIQRGLDEAKQMLMQRHTTLLALADALMTKDTLEGPDIVRIVEQTTLDPMLATPPAEQLLLPLPGPLSS